MEKPLSLAAKLLLLGAGGLAVVAGPILFLFPTQTEAYFAWTIKHPLTPVFMGANYLGGLGAFWSLRMNRWSVARVQMPGIFVFAAAQLLATLLHIPIFNWSHPVAWAWLLVYVASPVATLLVYSSMEKGYTPSNERASGRRPFSLFFQALAVISAVIGLGLILWPFFYTADRGSAVPWWAWTLTPLTARVVGGWYLAAATLYYTLSGQRAVKTRVPTLIALIIVTGMQLIGALVWRSAFDGSSLCIWIYFLNSLVVLVFSSYEFVRTKPSLSTVPSRSA